MSATAEPSTTLSTVFWATDFSENADLAQRYAIALARRHGAKLVVGHVVETVPIGPYPVLPDPAIAIPEAEAEIRRAASDRLEQLAEELAETLGEGADRVEAHSAMGAPGATLVELAAKHSADVIVIGTRGLTGFRHLLLGSTAEAVVRRAQCPVLAVHPGDPEPEAAIQRVVLPTDFSDQAVAAIDRYRQLFAPDPRPEVLLVHADETPPYLEAFQHARLAQWHVRDDRRAQLEERMQPLVERLERDGFSVERLVTDGGPVEGILQVAASHEANLVVIANRGRSAVVNTLLGRTAQRVVQHARCPVLVIPVPGD